MQAAFKIFGSILLAYLFGSIPTGVWITQKIARGDCQAPKFSTTHKWTQCT